MLLWLAAAVSFVLEIPADGVLVAWIWPAIAIATLAVSATAANVNHNRQRQAADRQKRQNDRITKNATIGRINSSGREHFAVRGSRKRRGILDSPLIPPIGY